MILVIATDRPETALALVAHLRATYGFRPMTTAGLWLRLVDRDPSPTEDIAVSDARPADLGLLRLALPSALLVEIEHAPDFPRSTAASARIANTGTFDDLCDAINREIVRVCEHGVAMTPSVRRGVTRWS